MWTFLLLLLALFCPLGVSIPAQGSFATGLISFKPGGGGGIFVQANILGAPRGGGHHAGSTHVLSLGTGGSVVLGFGVEICDGPGADFIVSENVFIPGWSLDCFAELAFVEVSTDGSNFVRFPASYAGPQQDPGPFGTLPLGCTENLAGATPVLAYPAQQPAIDPVDPCLAGGDPFDLADLAGDPMVQKGLVDLKRIRFIRIVDIPSGKVMDRMGKRIWDGGFSADIDAVTIIQHQGNQNPRGPAVKMETRQGEVKITISDPDGLDDLDPASLHLSINSFAQSPTLLFTFFRITGLSTGSVESTLSGLPAALRFTMGCSVRDRAGHFSCARRAHL